ncbi:MAG TPA: hypothetical protein VNU94_09585 [Acidobacteriaceae bacterium]|jgi:hypothetical protein|nr:hypothetical protein [Acidobacteriaceae bacterium]
MGVTPVVVIGFLLGFGFGVGCALAVMYSIYMGGYKKAVSEAAEPSERFLKIKAKLKD